MENHCKFLFHKEASFPQTHYCVGLQAWGLYTLFISMHGTGLEDTKVQKVPPSIQVHEPFLLSTKYTSCYCLKINPCHFVM